MDITGIPFGTTDWSAIEPTEHKGITGTAYWRTRQFGNIRVRMVEYTAGYLAEPHRSSTSLGATLFVVD